MMHLAAALLVGMLSPGPDGDKAALRYKFEKGEKFQFKLSYTMNTKIDEIPDEFKGVFGDGPIEMRFECLMDAEVTEIDKDGKAAIEGKWRRMKAKGNMLTEVDFAYDADKPGETSGDPDAYNDIEEQFREATRRPVKLTVDRAGRLTVAPSPGKSAEAAQLLTLNGLMGALPEAAVGVGDSWKGEHALNAPGLAGAVDLRIQSDNTYKSDEGGCAVLTSKFTVAAVEGKDGGGGGRQAQDRWRRPGKDAVPDQGGPHGVVREPVDDPDPGHDPRRERRLGRPHQDDGLGRPGARDPQIAGGPCAF